MDWKTLLFSPNGRINRQRYWLTALGIYAVYMIFYLPLILSIDKDTGLTSTQMVLMGIFIALSFVITYIGIILGIKRFHDRDKSGWWVLIALVPFIGGIWYLVEAGFLRGTMGRNRFGPDPLAPTDDIVEVFGAPERQSIR